jgi:glycosyltransferase involved in cell wall biosynthesis
LSTGSLAPFWAIAGLKDVPVTATVHDPPQGLWFVGRTRFIARHRVLNHAIHYPLRPLSRAIEGVAYRNRTLFALTDAGRRSIERTYPRTRALYVPCMAFDRPTIMPAQERPKAVGFFGYAYRGKGFDQIARIRELLPDDILIRIAGRGTESLPRADGIEVLGGVDGPEEDAFFESIRAIIVPYGKRHWYAETYPASGVGASAQSYSTPVISTGYGGLVELDEATGAVTVQPTAESDGVARVLAQEITSLVNDRERLTQLGLNAEKTRYERSRAGTGKAFAEAWAQLLEQTTAGV